MFHVTKEPETVVTGEETTTTDLLWKKHLWNCRYILFSFTTAAKCLISLSEFQPSGPITFGKSQRAWRLNYFFPIQVSSALNRKLAVRQCRTDKCTIQQPNNNSQKIFLSSGVCETSCISSATLRLILRSVNTFIHFESMCRYSYPRPPAWKCFYCRCCRVKRSQSIWRRSCITPLLYDTL